MTTEIRLYPKPTRAERAPEDYRWHVQYVGMTYEFRVVSWIGYYRTKFGARMAAFWYYRITSYHRGTVTLVDTWNAVA